MHRTLAALTLAALLGATSPPSLLDQLWSLLSSLWGTTSQGGDAGIGWDPDGGNTPPQQQNGDAGIGWDPDGGKS